MVVLSAGVTPQQETCPWGHRCAGLCQAHRVVWLLPHHGQFFVCQGNHSESSHTSACAICHEGRSFQSSGADESLLPGALQLSFLLVETVSQSPQTPAGLGAAPAMAAHPLLGYPCLQRGPRLHVLTRIHESCDIHPQLSLVSPCLVSPSTPLFSHPYI